MAEAPTTIAGGGLSGLAAAITLAQGGRTVTVYERGQSCGARRHNDIEGIETWIFDEPPLDYLARKGLPISFEHLPMSRFHYAAPDGQLHTADSDRPFFHLVQRGPGEGSIDAAFYRHAVEAGVQFVFGEARKPGQVDIYAAGPRRADAYAHGFTFSTSAPDGVYLLLGKAIAPLGYAYGIVWNGRGTLAAAFKPPMGDPQTMVDRLAERWQAATHSSITGMQKFASYGNHARRPRLSEQGSLLVGEAAGWQDALFGFGMNFALRSGVLAAKSILMGDNYVKRCRVELSGRQAAGWVSRRLYDRLNDRTMDRLARALIERKRVWQALSRAARPTPLKLLLARWAPA